MNHYPAPTKSQTCPSCGGRGTERIYYTDHDVQHQPDAATSTLGWMMGEQPKQITSGDVGPERPCGVCRGRGTTRLITRGNLILAGQG